MNACDDALLTIAADIESPFGYRQVDASRCEGRYGGLFGASIRIAAVVGFERSPLGRTLVPTDSLVLSWPAAVASEIRLSAVVLRPRLFYRMDATPDQVARYDWPLDKLGAVLGSETLAREEVAVLASGRDEASGEFVLLPVTTSGDGKRGYRITLETAARLERLAWRLSAADGAGPSLEGRIDENLTRNRFVGLSVPDSALALEGRYVLELFADLPDGAIVTQRVDLLHHVH